MSLALSSDLRPDEAVDDLIDCLIANWSGWEDEATARYYLDELVVEVSRDPLAAALDQREEELVFALHSVFGEKGWKDFPDRVRTRVEAWRQGRRHRALVGSLAEWIEIERERRRREAAARRKLEEEESLRLAALEEEGKRLEREREVAERKRRREEAARLKSAALAELEARLTSDYLRASAAALAKGADSMLIHEDVLALQAKVVRAWAESAGLDSLDDEQIAAVAAVGSDVLVAARAGSGKTRTLAARALFLIQHCHVDPCAILLLAFNRAAAAEMASRIQKTTATPPFAMTFHSLAYAITHPEEEIIFDNDLEQQLRRSGEIQEIIDDHIRSEEFGPIVRELMLGYFRDDWDAIVAGGHDLSISEFIERRRMVARETFAGEYVKSYGEKLIANTLFEYGIDYKYEQNFRRDGFNYRPDFTLLRASQSDLKNGKGGIIIEYFGLQGDPDYDEQSERKRTFWAEKEGWTLLEYSPKDVAIGGSEAFAARLLADLLKLNCGNSRRSVEEIWELVKGRAVDSFSKAMGSFLGRCRKRDLNAAALDREIENHVPLTDGERLFLSVARSVYRRYLARLEERSLIDFDGLIWKSVEALDGGAVRFSRQGGRENGDLASVRFVMVDEFQDFSEMFLALARGIRKCSPGVEFFCVGDDWQAINAFAGSELRFFRDFHEHFPGARRLDLGTNYRSDEKIVTCGNALMRGMGQSARPFARNGGGSVSVARMDSFEPTSQEEGRGNGDELTFAVLRLVRSFLDRGLKVALLARMNSVPWFVDRRGVESAPRGLELLLERVLSKIPEDERGRVEISTVHKFKGKERDAVIVLDAVQRRFPLIHPHWLFLRLHGDSPAKIEEEERRLFYVAISRAQRELVLITDRSQESLFLRNLKLGEVDWNLLMPAPPLGGELLEVRVADAFEVKDQLKSLGYRWQGSARKYWRRAVPASGFDISKLLQQPWARPRVRVEVYSETMDLLHSLRVQAEAP